MTRFADRLTDVADILNSEVQDGVIMLTIGDSRDDKGIAANASTWGLAGFFSRPKPPTSEGSAEALYLVDGDDKEVIATRDNRFAHLAGTLSEGDCAIAAGDARLFVRDDGSIIAYTVSIPDDDNMLFHMSGKEGKLLATVGTSRLVMTNERIEMSTNAASIVIDEDGVTINGKHFGCGTATGHLGLVAPLTPPFAGINAIVYGPTGMAGVGSTRWTVSGP